MFYIDCQFTGKSSNPENFVDNGSGSSINYIFGYSNWYCGYKIKTKRNKVRKILFAVQKIEEELEEKAQNKENDIEIEKKTKKDK